MGATILRQWLVLTMLPRSPRRLDTASIESRLRERGVEVHRRTIQRDLLELAQVFPIVADERAKPYGWCWSDDARYTFTLPAPKTGTCTTRLDVSLRVRRDGLTEILERLGACDLRLVDDAVDGSFATVFAALEDSPVTRRRLLGAGDEIEVLTPLALRREIADRARAALAAHAR